MWRFRGTIKLRSYQGHTTDGAPYFYRPKAIVTPYLTVSQTGRNSSVVENHVWSVAGALHKSVARPAADPGQWDWGLTLAHYLCSRNVYVCTTSDCLVTGYTPISSFMTQSHCPGSAYGWLRMTTDQVFPVVLLSVRVHPSFHPCRSG